MQHAVFLAPFGELAEPRALIDVAVAAEATGWDAIFLWDHLLRPVAETTHIGDAWISLAAIATVTDRIRLGTMVTPITAPATGEAGAGDDRPRPALRWDASSSASVSASTPAAS